METSLVPDRAFTQEEFRRWLDERPGSDINHYELLDGRIAVSPPAGWPHGDREAAITTRLREFVHGRGLGIVQGSSAGYDLPSGDTVEPDVSFISRERFAAGPAPVEGQLLRIVPSLAVEIVSPSSARRDREQKRLIYERNGVDEYWLVDGRTRSVTVLVRRGGAFDGGTVFSTGVVRSTVLPGLEVALDEIFGA